MSGKEIIPRGGKASSSPSDYWTVCLDGSDTAVHISCRKELFKNLMPDRRRLSSASASDSDDEVFSESSGTLSIECPSEGGLKTLDLPNAFYVPQSKDTCLSLSKLFKQHLNSRIQFTPEGCSVELNLGRGMVIRLRAESKGCFNFTLERFPGFCSGTSTPSTTSSSRSSLSPASSGYSTPAIMSRYSSSPDPDTRTYGIWPSRSSESPVPTRKQITSFLDSDGDVDMDEREYEHSTEGPYCHSIDSRRFRSYDDRYY